jgi:3D (Asp-Asp-Asp) domain-containing protein
MSGRRRLRRALQGITSLGLCGAAALAAAEPGLPAIPAMIESRVPQVDPLLRGGDGRVPPEVERALGSPRLSSPSGLAPHPEDSSKSIEGMTAKLRLSGKVKDCCGYPLGQPGTYKMTFYWLAYESEYASEPADVEIYTKDGFLIGRFPRVFVFELKLEGTGVLRDGRVLNYDRPCPFGIGTCFKELDRRDHPVGKGAQQRALVPYRSVAIDPRFVPLGTPLYVPELRGMPILTQDPSQPEERHDGCVRADDTGGGIKRRELDLFVSSYAQYRATEAWLLGSQRITPMVEEPRCEYLRALGGPYGRSDPGQDRKSEATDWAALHPAKAAPASKNKGERAVASTRAGKHGAGKHTGKTAQSASKAPTPRRKTAAG